MLNHELAILASLLLAPFAASSPQDSAAAPEQEAVPAREQPESHKQMVALLDQVREQARETNPYVGDLKVPEITKELAELPPDAPKVKRWRLLGGLAFAELRLGLTDEAVAHYEEAWSMVPQMPKAPPREVEQLRYDMGIAYMRWGENRNCVARHNSQSCLFPIGPAGVHSDQEGSRKAIAVFEELLGRDPARESAHRAGEQWLLNIAYMTIGGYPDQVPEKYRIAPSMLASEEEFPHFPDVARDMGFTDRNLAGGTILEDFDQDGHLDVVLTDWHPGGQMRYWRGHGDGTFEERTKEAGLTGIVGGLNCMQTDFDNDGWIDIYVTRGAWLHDAGRYPDSLLKNNGDGTFSDVSIPMGLAEVHYPGQTASWGDFDNDGDLDLYVGNETDPNVVAPNQLFRNDGARFVDIATAAGVRNDHFAKAVAWGDYDGDRFPDLFVSNQNGPNRLYHNNKDGTFTNVAEEAGVVRPLPSFPSWFWDFDNDGALDLFASSYWPELERFAAAWLGKPSPYEPPCVYKGDGHGNFKNVAAELGLKQVSMPMGANFGDLDNDGFLDFYLGTGYPLYDGLMPNVMYHNKGGKKFLDVTTAGGFGHLQKGHGIAFGDLDEDGDQDVFAHMGGAFPGDAFLNAIFQNPGFGNHWIKLRLAGVRTNRVAIGARIRCDITDGSEHRSVYRTVNSGGSFGANSLEQHIGLGKATKIDVLEIDWPTSDTKQVFKDVAIDRAYRIVEGESELREPWKK